jgi:hypothetical protein
MISQYNHEKVSGNTYRLGVTFHRTFSLSRPSIAKIVQLAKVLGDKTPIGRKTIRQMTNLGSVYVEAMPRYAYGAGLLDRGNHLTKFGSFACDYDPLLENIVTQWLIHYHLSAPDGPGPAYWHDLVIHRFLPGDEFTHEQISAQIQQFVSSVREMPPRDEDADSSATVFVGTYTKSDGLKSIGVLEETKPKTYRVLDPDPPSTWVVAYALLDFWKARFPNQTTINLSDLYGENGLTSLFMLSKGRLNAMLEEMQREGMLELYRIAPPYQVVLLTTDEVPILEKLYGVGNPG